MLAALLLRGTYIIELWCDSALINITTGRRLTNDIRATDSVIRIIFARRKSPEICIAMNFAAGSLCVSHYNCAERGC